MKAHGQKAEEGIGAGDEGDGDGEHIVDEEGAARYDARLFADGVGGDDVPAASVGEMLDDPGVGVGNDKDGERRGEGEKDGEVRVGPEGPERLFGTVGRGREAVRPEADPGEDGDKAQLVEERGISYVSRRADYGMAEPFGQGFVFRVWRQRLPPSQIPAGAV